MQSKQKTLFSFSDTKPDGKDYKGRLIKRTVTAGLVQFAGQTPYFSFTVWGTDDSGGCDHKTIARLWPELIPFLPLHLARHDGEPLHVFANGLYWLGFTKLQETDFEKAARHFRDTPEKMKLLKKRIEEGEVNLLSDYIAGKKEEWKKEADACIEFLKTKVNLPRL